VAGGAAFLLAAAVVVRLVTTLTASPLLQSLLGLAGVWLIAARAGVATDPLSRPALRRGLLGAGLVAIAVAATVGLALIGGQLSGPVEVSAPSPILALGLIELLAAAIRDELYLRGIPLLFAARAGVPAPMAVGYAALCSVAVLALAPELTWTAAALVLAAGLLSAVLWHRTGDIWAPAGARFAWLLLADAGFAGELPVALGSEGGQLSAGAGSSGAVVWIATFALLALCYLLARHRIPAFPRSPAAGEEETGSG